MKRDGLNFFSQSHTNPVAHEYFCAHLLLLYFILCSVGYQPAEEGGGRSVGTKLYAANNRKKMKLKKEENYLKKKKKKKKKTMVGYRVYGGWLVG